MKRFGACLAAAGAIAMAGLFAPAAQADEAIKFSYLAVAGFTDLYVAADQGMLTKRGIDLQFVQTAISGNIPGLIVSNSVQLGGPTMPSVLQADDAGLDLVVIAAASVYPLYGDVLVARPGSGVTKPADLKGKTIGVPGLGALLDIMLRRNMKQNGVDPKDVKFVEVGFPQAADALKSGQIDAYPSQAPFTARILQSGAGVAVNNWLQDTPDGTLTTVYASTRKWANEHKDDIAKLRDAMREAETFEKDPAHKGDVYNSIGKHTGIDPKIASTIPMQNMVVNITPAQVQWWIDICKQQGLIKKDIKPADVLFP